jgi:RNA polymerase sigma factor (sigma-70 family)
VTATFDHPLLDPRVCEIIRFRATRFTRTHGFCHEDQQDICQDFALDCLRRLPKFDAHKSSIRTFVHRIVEHHAATLADSHQAACRDRRRCQESLDAPVHIGPEASVPFGDTVSSDDYEMRLGRSARTQREYEDLRIDVVHAISLLPEELAVVAILLLTVNIVEAAQLLGISRSTLHRRLDRLREAFSAAGLDRYLGPHRNGPRRKELSGSSRWTDFADSDLRAVTGG